MKAMLLREIVLLHQNPAPLSYEDIAEPVLREGEILLRVTRCGVCHTELDEIEGRMPPTYFPVIPGHQVVGVVEDRGTTEASTTLAIGQRVGVAWIASACGQCQYCLSGQENLCAQFKATGRDINGGYASFMKVHKDFAFPLPDALSNSEAAPLLCAGAIGYRSLQLSNIRDGQNLGLMGFGSSNHLVLKLAKYKYPDAKIFVFSRNRSEREFALSLGAAWAGTIEQRPLKGLDAIIDTTPVWGPVSEALKYLSPGGRLVINAIRKESSDRDVLSHLEYPSQLWMEKEIKSVANVTRADVREFLQIAAEANIKPEYQEYELKDANQALLDMKQGKIRGAKVLRI